MKRPFRVTYPKKNKYGAQKVVHDGIEFDSTIEGERYLYLKTLLLAGEIKNLETHKTFEILPKQTRIEVKHLKTKDKEVEKVVFQNIEFTPDFVYEKDGKLIAEDVKGSLFVVSKDFPIRRKLLYYFHNIYVNVVIYSKSKGWQVF